MKRFLKRKTNGLFYSLRFPEKFQVFGIFMLLQAVLFIPVMLIFTFRGDAGAFAVASIAAPNLYVATILSLIALFVFLWISRREPASFVLPLSFALTPYLITFIFTFITLIGPYDSSPYEWGKYPRLVLLPYAVFMVTVSSLTVSIIKIIRRKKRI